MIRMKFPRRHSIPVLVVAFFAIGSSALHSVSASGGPTLTIDANASLRHPISPDIYGMNYADEAFAKEVGVTVDRWGGDAVTRYNWQLDAQNSASDYFFESLGNPVANVAALPDGSSSDQFIEKDQRIGANTLLTIPLIGWTAKSRNFSCSFSVAKYGAQQSTDSPNNPDCGNGYLPPPPLNPPKITGNDPTDTSVAINQTFDAAWVTYLVGKYGSGTGGGVAYYNMDNEPEYWHDIHFDVHPAPLTYDELGNTQIAYAAAVKAADPTAKVLGPTVSDWYAYFDSPVDVGNTMDRDAHGGVPFMEWYLQQMHAYEIAHGTRILDYFDLHYYTKGDGVSLAPAGSVAVQAKRLRSTRELWDPTYTAESYIGVPVNLIPMIRTWIQNDYPGTKINIGEYNWGGLEDINGALAQADVLGIFGREGVDMAEIWGAPASNQPGAYAFRIYRNYDGAGAKFGDSGISASSADQSQLSVYGAIRSSDGALTLIMVNKTGSDLTSTLNLGNFNPASSAKVYRYSSANLNAIVAQPDQAITAGGFSATYPASSITLVVIPAQTVSAQIDSMGIYRTGTFYLRLHNSQGFADFTVGFNPPGNNFPVVGDWTGAGFDAVGVYDRNTGNFTLCTANVTATCANAANHLAFTLGNPNDTPLSGRWALSATHAGAGVYRPTNGVLYLKAALSTGFADHAMVMGLPGDAGVAGDWTGKGFDSPGIYRPSATGYFLSNQVTDGPVFADIQLTYGTANDLPIVGDWIAQGHDGVGMFRASNGFAYLRNTLTTGFADNAFFYGLTGDQPIAGHWQPVYPPIAPRASAPILIQKTAAPSISGGIVPGGNGIGQ